MSLVPCLAYPLSTIDPFLDDGKRNDVAWLLPKLSRVLNSLIDGGREFMNALDGDAEAIFEGISDAKTCKDAIMIRLVAPMTTLIEPEACDEILTQKQRNAKTFPVAGDHRVALMQNRSNPNVKPRIVLALKHEAFATAGKVDAEVELEQGDGVIHATMVTFQSKRVRMAMRLAPGEVMRARVESLFAHDIDAASKRVDRMLLPETPSGLPADIMLRVADFWQRQLHAHVLVAASVGDVDGCTFNGVPMRSNRFLAFESMSVTTKGRDEASRRYVLRAVLHPSATACLCGIHACTPPSDSVRSHVEFNLSMCGRTLRRMTGDPNSVGACPIHKNGTPNVKSLPNICCYDTTAQISCVHFNAYNEFRPGVWIRDIPLSNLDTLHVQTLLAGALQCCHDVHTALTPAEPVNIFGKRKWRADDAVAANGEVDTEKAMMRNVEHVCQCASIALDEDLDAVDELRTCKPCVVDYDEDQLDNMDVRAAELLREGKTFRKRRVTTREFILVQKKDDGSGEVSQLKKPDGLLNDVRYQWLFPALPK